jgi:cytidylate kinase
MPRRQADRPLLGPHTTDGATTGVAAKRPVADQRRDQQLRGTGHVAGPRSGHNRRIRRNQGRRMIAPNQSGRPGQTGQPSPAATERPADHDLRWVVAIDGPGAAGKSTVARELAERLDALLFDTGALYRAVTLAAGRTGVSQDDGDALARVAERSTIRLRPPSIHDGRQVDVLLDGEDVTWAIRAPEVDAAVSEVSAHPAVRLALLPMQRQIADEARVIMVGRDIGTIIAPDAGTKLYLDASPEERARRRYIELRERGVPTDFDAVLRDLRARDDYDSSRPNSPLAAAMDATTIATDGRTVDELVTEIEALVRDRWRELSASEEHDGRDRRANHHGGR